MEVLLVGIDGACERVLDPLLRAGCLPNLGSILENGTWGPLTASIPPWTASAWPSMYTGMNPGKHGVFDFLSFDGYDWDVVDASDVRERPIWHLLDRHGLESVVVNVPVTHPVRPFNGALIPGYSAPEDPPSHPPGVLDEVRDVIGNYRVYPTFQGKADRVPVAQRREEYVDLVRMRGAAFRTLTDRFDPDFGFLQFQQSDTVFHDCPEHRDVTRAVYEAVDHEVGAAVDACEPDTVILVSDHGVGPYNGYEFRVNEFLRERGFVTAVRGGEGMPTWATLRDTRLRRGAAASPEGPDVPAAVMATLARAGLTSQRLARAFDAVGIGDLVRRHAPALLVSAATEQVDFPSSKAYMRSRIECGVRINLDGREPDGCVAREDYESVRTDLIARLSSAETPDGRSVFSDVARREEYFHGPEAHRAVDVVTVPASFDHFLSAKLSGEPFGEPSEPWNHKLEGMIAMTGAAVTDGTRLRGAHLLDVAPTVVAALDLPYDGRMDGDVLPPIEPAGMRAYPSFEPEGVTGEHASIENRLADLGYIE